MLDGLPNCVFDASGPLRQYSAGSRAVSFFAKVAELSAVGALTGTVSSLASNAAVSLRKQADPSFEPSTSVPSIQRSSGGLAAFFAANANVRYQLIGGLDRYLFNHSSYMWAYMGISGLARLGSQAVGEMSRPWWQGLPNPATLPARPRTKRVSKRVHKRVPKAVPRTVDTLPAPAMAAAAVAGMDAAPVDQQQMQSSTVMVAPVHDEGAATPAMAPEVMVSTSQPMQLPVVPLEMTAQEVSTAGAPAAQPAGSSHSYA